MVYASKHTLEYLPDFAAENKAGFAVYMTAMSGVMDF